jgi:hypothetical protein
MWRTEKEKLVGMAMILLQKEVSYKISSLLTIKTILVKKNIHTLRTIK